MLTRARLLPRPRLRLALLSRGGLPLPLTGARLILRRCCGAGAFAAPAAPPAAAPTLAVWRRRALRANNRRNQPVQATGTAPPAGLVQPSFVLPDAVVPLDQPLFQRSLDLRLGCAGLLGPDAGPVRSDRFGRRIGVGRFRFDDAVRLELGHHQGV
ncbi:MAG: hypothetical protein ABI401_07755 [Candidatus Dormibacter sp.]